MKKIKEHYGRIIKKVRRKKVKPIHKRTPEEVAEIIETTINNELVRIFKDLEAVEGEMKGNPSFSKSVKEGHKMACIQLRGLVTRRLRVKTEAK